MKEKLTVGDWVRFVRQLEYAPLPVGGVAGILAAVNGQTAQVSVSRERGTLMVSCMLSDLNRLERAEIEARCVYPVDERPEAMRTTFPGLAAEERVPADFVQVDFGKGGASSHVPRFKPGDRVVWRPGGRADLATRATVVSYDASAAFGVYGVRADEGQKYAPLYTEIPDAAPIPWRSKEAWLDRLVEADAALPQPVASVAPCAKCDGWAALAAESAQRANKIADASQAKEDTLRRQIAALEQQLAAARAEIGAMVTERRRGTR